MEKAGTLFIIATPIGNLEDITLRALETLKSLDVLFCEDTRHTAKLLARYEIHVPVLDSYREEVHSVKGEKVIAALEEGKMVGLVTDAGTPCISDPGFRLVELVRERLPEVKVVPIPGASAVIAALSVSGFQGDQFMFLGFPPHKGRDRWFKEAVANACTVVFYESPHRIEKALESLMALCPDRMMMIGRELTKMHEQVMRGTVSQVSAESGLKDGRGEYVVILAPEKR